MYRKIFSQLIFPKRINIAKMSDLKALRIKYKDKTDRFRESDIEKKDAISLFSKWFDEALNTKEIYEPNAMCLATATKDGLPSARFVLLKHFDDSGFVFYTNYSSRKAKDIEENPNVAATIYWLPLHRSVRIEGIAEKISHEESEKYFHERPRASQIGAVASPQSELIPSREYLDQIEADIKEKIGDNEIPLPNWGGYRIAPRLIEFWQGQTNRLHDRIRFRKSDESVDEKLTHRAENGWVMERLAP